MRNRSTIFIVALLIFLGCFAWAEFDTEPNDSPGAAVDCQSRKGEIFGDLSEGTDEDDYFLVGEANAFGLKVVATMEVQPAHFNDDDFDFHL